MENIHNDQIMKVCLKLKTRNNSKMLCINGEMMHRYCQPQRPNVERLVGRHYINQYPSR